MLAETVEIVLPSWCFWVVLAWMITKFLLFLVEVAARDEGKW